MEGSERYQTVYRAQDAIAAAADYMGDVLTFKTTTDLPTNNPFNRLELRLQLELIQLSAKEALQALEEPR